MSSTVVKRASPNGWDISILKYDLPQCDDYVYEVVENDEEGYPEEGVQFDTLAEAEAYFEDRCAELRNTPNWEAQARYDEEHGTVNGYDPVIEMWRNEY